MKCFSNILSLSSLLLLANQAFGAVLEERHGSPEYCASRDLIYNPKTAKCFNPRRHPSEFNCAYLGLKFNESSKTCYKANGTSWKSIKYCKSKNLIYDFNTKKCYNPARHPSNWNCAYLGKSYDADKDVCFDKPDTHPNYCTQRGLMYNPSTNKCYNPARHPSYANCALYGKDYDPETKQCCDERPRPPPSGDCHPGQYPVLDHEGKPTKVCASCGNCTPYHGLGTPVCKSDKKTCTLLCPHGQHVKSKWGLLYCA